VSAASGGGAEAAAIPGYDFGTATSAKSPVTMEELRELERTVSWGGADAAVMQKYRAAFEEHAEAMVDSWRKVIGEQPHLAKWFFGPDGKADDAYKAAVKKRFVQWVVDVATRPHDQAWLDYQEEIGLRHTPAKKNATDGAHTPPVVPLRYVLGFMPVVFPVRQFFEGTVKDQKELMALEWAWLKAVLLHVTLWSRPFTREGLW
jgi:hypothetical protein